VLVDTNVISELMRPRPAQRVLAWAAKQERFSLSVVTVEELQFGLSAKPSARMDAWLERFVERHCEVLPVTYEIARRCGAMRAAHRLEGRPRTQADMLIAATAWEHRLPLATRNRADFHGCGIRIVDPFAE
jgi:predicted nucleic acid-binding protein